MSGCLFFSPLAALFAGVWEVSAFYNKSAASFFGAGSAVVVSGPCKRLACVAAVAFPATTWSEQPLSDDGLAMDVRCRRQACILPSRP